MDFLLKNILPISLYIKWFNPKEDLEDGCNIYLHLNNVLDNTTYSLKFKKGVSRYDVVSFLKNLHDKAPQNAIHSSRSNSHSSIVSIDSINSLNSPNNLNDSVDYSKLENDEVIRQECSCLFVFYNNTEIDTALNILKIFTKDKFIFFGETNISVVHEQDEENKLWYTHFYKNNNIKCNDKKESSKCIACICNRYTYIFD